MQGELQRSWFVVTAAGMITLNGHLYDPVKGIWSPSPPLPVGVADPVLAGGDSSILACFGLSGTEFGTTCHLLRPAPASLIAPRVITCPQPVSCPQANRPSDARCLPTPITGVWDDVD